MLRPGRFGAAAPPADGVPAAPAGVLTQVHQRVPVFQVGEDSYDEEGAKHRHSADDEKRLVALVLPDDVGKDTQRDRQADRQGSHLKRTDVRDLGGYS